MMVRASEPPVQVFGREPELDEQIARQVFRR
jgi:hypothetical protein